MLPPRTRWPHEARRDGRGADRRRRRHRQDPGARARARRRARPARGPARSAAGGPGRGTGAPGTAARALVADITRRDGRAAICATAQAQGANVLINNAGLPCFGALEVARRRTHRHGAADQPRRAGPAHAARSCRTCARRPRRACSTSARCSAASGLPGYSVYSAGKFGLRGFSEALRRELAGSPVCVQYLGPRTTRTAFNDARVEAYNRATATRADATDAWRTRRCACCDTPRRAVHRFSRSPRRSASTGSCRAGSIASSCRTPRRSRQAHRIIPPERPPEQGVSMKTNLRAVGRGLAAGLLALATTLRRRGHCRGRGLTAAAQLGNGQVPHAREGTGSALPGAQRTRRAGGRGQPAAVPSR